MLIALWRNPAAQTNEFACGEVIRGPMEKTGRSAHKNLGAGAHRFKTSASSSCNQRKLEWQLLAINCRTARSL